jgi:hypothetical protein
MPSHAKRNEREQYLYPFYQGSASPLTELLKAPSLNTTTLGTKFQHANLEGAHSNHSTTLLL